MKIKMKFKSENGITGIDIAISITVLFIFVSLIAVLTYNFNSSSKEAELKNEALNIAIDKIEYYKKEMTITDIKNMPEEVRAESDFELPEKGFRENRKIEEYKPEVYKLTVKIYYIYKAQEQSVELSTIVTKES